MNDIRHLRIGNTWYRATRLRIHAETDPDPQYIHEIMLVNRYIKSNLFSNISLKQQQQCVSSLIVLPSHSHNIFRIFCHALKCVLRDHRLNMELDLQSLFGLLWEAALIV